MMGGGEDVCAAGGIGDCWQLSSWLESPEIEVNDNLQPLLSILGATRDGGILKHSFCVLHCH